MSIRARLKPDLGVQSDAKAQTGAPDRGAGRNKKISVMARRDAIAGYLFVSPAVLLFLIFIAGPLIGAIALSLFQWDLLTPARFAGLGNYALLFTDPVVGQALVNTFVFTFWSIVLHIGLGLLLALAVNRAIPA